MVDCDGCYFDEAHNLTWRPSSSFGQGLTPEDYQLPRSYLFTLGLAF